MRAERFQHWLRLLLFRLMGVMSSLDSAGEAAWAAALSALVHLSTYDGGCFRLGCLNPGFQQACSWKALAEAARALSASAAQRAGC